MDKKFVLYKWLSIVLAAIIVIALIVFGLMYYGDSRFNQGAIAGQQSVMNFMLSNLKQNGQFTISFEDNSSVVLAPVQVGYNYALNGLLTELGKSGKASIFTNDTEVVIAIADVKALNTSVTE